MKVKGFMSDGNIFVTRKGIDKPYVLFHEYAHIYALKNADYEKLEETARKILSEEQIQKEIYGEIRYKSLIAKKEAEDETAKQEFVIELFATAMGQFFKSVEDKLPSYKDFSDFQKNFANDLKKLAGEDYSNEVFGVAKSLAGTQPKKATAKKSTGKPKKATKKATKKVEDKPTFVVGDELDNGWLIVEYLGKGKYKIIDNDGNELVKTEKEIDEA